MKNPKIMIPGILSLLIFSGIYWNCSGTVDTTRDFAMVLNGREYKVALVPAKGFIREMDSGFTNSFAYTIMFPAKKFNRFDARGFELTFDPDVITVGEVIESTAGDSNYSFGVTYYPLVGHKMNEGILLEYSSRVETGDVKVRFDILEPTLGGRVKGTILKATLFGYFQEHDSMERSKPDDPKKLEIYNFVFDTTFERSMF